MEISNQIEYTPRYNRYIKYIEKREQLFNQTNNMISASSTRNYLLRDPVVDFLKLNNKIDFDPFTKYIMNLGNEFEKELIKYIKLKHTVLQIANHYSDSRKESKFIETIEAMKQGVPIIYQGVIVNKNNNTFGMPDLLVRSDYINKLMEYNVISDEEAKICSKKLNINWHYKVVDIKHSSIELTSNGIFIINKENIPAYKGQLYIYTSGLNDILGIEINKSFIWGRKYEYTANKNKIVIDNFLNKLGTIDYDDYDNKYIELTENAIIWSHKVKKNKWNINYNELNILNSEFFPNMNNISDSEIQKIKSKIAIEIGEITLLYRCGIKERELAHSKGIYSIYDPKLNASVMEMNGISGMIVDRMLNINKQDKVHFIPQKFSFDSQNWKYNNNDVMEFTIDFETFNMSFESSLIDGVINNKSQQYVFLIGIYYIVNNEHGEKQSFSTSTLSGKNKVFSDNEHYYEYFLLKEKSDESELQLFQEFYERINILLFLFNKKIAKFYHWTNAEITFYNHFKSKNKDFQFNDNHFVFYDLYDVFIGNRFVLKNCYNYSLKSIAKGLYNFGYIKTIWDSNNLCSNGLDAMFLAHQVYKNNNDENNIMESIIKYNKVDCSTVSELLQFIRKYSE
jgi:hypothetical protein